LQSDLSQISAALADRYLIDRELGHGAMATVFHARDLKHGRPVAIKVLHSELGPLGGQRFLREIRITAQLQHPHILALLDSGDTGGILYYVMPYVQGESLRDRLGRESQLSVGDAVRIAGEVLDALDYAHRHGVIHRDIKPENILLDEDGHVLVADFGIARAIDAASTSLTETGVSIGTPAYMSPEQASAERDVDARSDLYAVGCVLFEMLAGEPPFTGSTAQAVIAKRFATSAPSVRVLREGVPPGVEAALTRALSRAPADRFATAADFRDALTQAPASAPGYWRKRRLAPLIGSVVALVLLGTGGLLARRWISGREQPLRNALAVLPFAVRGDRSLSYLGEGMVDLLSTKIDGVGSLRSVDPRVLLSHVKRNPGVQEEPEKARRVAQRFGASHFLMGSVLAIGDSVQLSATLYGPEGDRTTTAQVVTAERELLRAVDHLAGELVQQLPGIPADRFTQLAAVTTGSFPALKEYLKGERAFRAIELDSAIAAFRRASQLDTAFALADYRLGVAGAWSGNALLWREAGERALRHSARLSQHDRLLLEANRAFQRGRLAEAERRYQAIVSAYPDDVEAWFWLGDIQLHTNPLRGRRAEESRRAFERAIALQPDAWESRLHLAHVAVSQRRFDEADTLLARFPRPLPGYRMVRDLSIGNTAERSAVLRALPGMNLADRALHEHGSTVAEVGDIEGSRVLSKLLTNEPRDPVWRAHGHILLAATELAQGKWRGAAREFTLAERLDPIEGLLYRGLFTATAPMGVPKTELRMLRGRMEQWNPFTTGDRPGRYEEIITAHNGVRPLVRLYVLGLLDIRLGNLPSTLARASELERAQAPDNAGSLAHDLAATLRAEAAWSRGDSKAALDVLESARLEIWDYRFPWPIYAHAHARLRRAEALSRLGQDQQAVAWLQGIVGLPTGFFDYMHRAPAHRLLAEIYDRQGMTDEAVRHYAEFVRLWGESDPEAQPLVAAARTRMAELRGERSPHR
jgi:serine/threonine-protein kinase